MFRHSPILTKLRSVEFAGGNREQSGALLELLNAPRYNIGLPNLCLSAHCRSRGCVQTTFVKHRQETRQEPRCSVLWREKELHTMQLNVPLDVEALVQKRL